MATREFPNTFSTDMLGFWNQGVHYGRCCSSPAAAAAATATVRALTRRAPQ
jgi:hypothetical protein